MRIFKEGREAFRATNSEMPLPRRLAAVGEVVLLCVMFGGAWQYESSPDDSRYSDRRSRRTAGISATAIAEQHNKRFTERVAVVEPVPTPPMEPPARVAIEE